MPTPRDGRSGKVLAFVIFFFWKALSFFVVIHLSSSRSSIINFIVLFSVEFSLWSSYSPLLETEIKFILCLYISTYSLVPCLKGKLKQVFMMVWGLDLIMMLHVFRCTTMACSRDGSQYMV